MLLIVLSIALAIGGSDTAGPADRGERVEALTRTIKCPKCPGQSVAESDVTTAREIRVDIAERVASGQTDDEIRDYYVSRYGQEVMLNPPRSGVAGLVWVLPVAALVVAAVVLVLTFRRWQRAEGLEATDADRALVAGALAGDGDGEPVADGTAAIDEPSGGGGGDGGGDGDGPSGAAGDEHPAVGAADGDR